MVYVETRDLRDGCDGCGGRGWVFAFSCSHCFPSITAQRRRMPHVLTAIHVSLFRQVVLRVAVGVDGAIKLLKGHQGRDQLIVGMQKAPKPLLGLDMVDLTCRRQFLGTAQAVGKLNVSQDFPSQELTGLETLARKLVLGNTLFFSVYALKGVQQVG